MLEWLTSFFNRSQTPLKKIITSSFSLPEEDHHLLAKKCKVHWEYQGLAYPTNNCNTCWEYYSEKTKGKW